MPWDCVISADGGTSYDLPEVVDGVRGTAVSAGQSAKVFQTSGCTPQKRMGEGILLGHVRHTYDLPGVVNPEGIAEITADCTQISDGISLRCGESTAKN